MSSIFDITARDDESDGGDLRALSPSGRAGVQVPAAVLSFCDTARDQFGDRLARVVLYGSRARGDHRPDSDWDIALYVRGLVNPYVEYGPLADLAGRLLAEADIEINARLFPAEAFLGGGSALHAHIRREGLSL